MGASGDYALAAIDATYAAIPNADWPSGHHSWCVRAPARRATSQATVRAAPASHGRAAAMECRSCHSRGRAARCHDAAAARPARRRDVVMDRKQTRAAVKAAYRCLRTTLYVASWALHSRPRFIAGVRMVIDDRGDGTALVPTPTQLACWQQENVQLADIFAEQARVLRRLGKVVLPLAHHLLLCVQPPYEKETWWSLQEFPHSTIETAIDWLERHSTPAAVETWLDIVRGPDLSSWENGSRHEEHLLEAKLARSRVRPGKHGAKKKPARARPLPARSAAPRRRPRTPPRWRS